VPFMIGMDARPDFLVRFFLENGPKTLSSGLETTKLNSATVCANASARNWFMGRVPMVSSSVPVLSRQKVC